MPVCFWLYKCKNQLDARVNVFFTIISIVFEHICTKKRQKFPPGKDISAEDTANDVTQVRDIVDIR